MTDARLLIRAPAKVNLHLAVGGLRADGYHDVTTVLHALAFGDTVRIGRAPAFAFSCTPDPGVPAEANLAWRAAHLMAAHFERHLDIAIEVEKRIPTGAGLGGGSADAAAVIAGLSALWGCELSDPALAALGGELGADVPFFLEGGAALHTGRGDVFERSLTSLDVPVVLVKPAGSVPTADAYRAFDAEPPETAPSPDGLIGALVSHDVPAVASNLFNNMTAAAVAVLPAVADALRFAESEPGVLGAAVAGSGSCVFGICADDGAATHAAVSARAAGFWAEPTRTVGHGCRVESV